MALPYSHITKEQDLMRNIMEKGEYPFQVKSIIQKSTKSGTNQMLEVELEVIDTSGRHRQIKDWIVIDMDEMAWKFRHFAESCGLGEAYDNRTIEARDFMGRKGFVKIGIKESEYNGEMRKNNNVIDYLYNEKNATHGSHEFNDDIDF